MNVASLHDRFKLQGKSFSQVTDLLSFVKNEIPELTQFLQAWFNEKSYVEVSTSGSTGRPKIIRLTKLAMRESAKATGSFFSLEEGSKALLCMDSSYIAGKMMIVRSLELGWELDVVKPNASPLQNNSVHYDFVAMVPLQLYNSMDQLHQIKKLIVGGGAVKRSIQEELQGLATEVYATYGMTETSTHIALKRLNPMIVESVAIREPYKVLKGISIGTDSRGCLTIEAPHLFDGLLITNDLVDLVGDSSFHWLGRSDSIINSGGVKLIPELIESKMENLISNRYFLVGLSDAMLGQKLVLCIEGEVWNDHAKQELLNALKHRADLHPYELPKEILFISEFSETQTGKINRKRSLKKRNVSK